MQCPAIANCKAYSGTNCRCTACNRYFGATALGACKARLGETLAYALHCFAVVGAHPLLAPLSLLLLERPLRSAPCPAPYAL